MTISIKRIYDPPAATDGYRVLIDRLWPRGVSKAAAAISLWCPGIAPSGELRAWFAHQPERYDEFVQRYRQELDANAPAVQDLRERLTGYPTVTLLFAARERRYNQATVLATYLDEQ